MLKKFILPDSPTQITADGYNLQFDVDPASEITGVTVTGASNFKVSDFPASSVTLTNNWNPNDPGETYSAIFTTNEGGGNTYPPKQITNGPGGGGEK